jgi:signal transduction histidine kinase
MLAIVTEGSEPLMSPRRPANDALEQIVLREATGMPGIRAYVVGPLKVGDPGWAAFHAPIQFGRQRIGTLSALRKRGEPFTQDERDALMRLANLAALAGASERYQQQRAEVARLQERQRIADDLHDHVAQILFGVQLQLDAALEDPAIDANVAEAIVRARGLLIRGDTAIRTVIRRLSHPIHADLPQRLTTLVSGFETEFSLPTHLEFSREAEQASKAIGKPLADVLVKVAREALANAAKHAGPCRVDVSLRINRRGRLMLTVIDDGLGLPNGRVVGRHGLGSLRQSVLLHGGSLRLHRGSAGGLKVTASVPL